MATKKPKTLENKITVILPKEYMDQEDCVVWVNNKRYIIKRGVSVEIPQSVAEVLNNSYKVIEKSYQKRTFQK